MLFQIKFSFAEVLRPCFLKDIVRWQLSELSRQTKSDSHAVNNVGMDRLILYVDRATMWFEEKLMTPSEAMLEFKMCKPDILKT